MVSIYAYPTKSILQKQALRDLESTVRISI